MSGETTPTNQRVYLLLQPLENGMARLDASLTPPAYDPNGTMLVLITRGRLPMGHPLALPLVTDPTENEDLRGPPGANATADQVTTAVAAWMTANAANVKGAPGDKGSAGTIAITKVTTLAAGQSVTIVNKGTASAAQLEIGIPAGTKGDTGPSRRVDIMEQTSAATGLVTFTFASAFDAAPDVTPRIKAPAGLIAATCEIVSVSKTQAVIRCARVVAGVPVLSAGVTISLRAEALA